jgi:hypothetical protein
MVGVPRGLEHVEPVYRLAAIEWVQIPLRDRSQRTEAFVERLAEDPPSARLKALRRCEMASATAMHPYFEIGPAPD